VIFDVIRPTAMVLTVVPFRSLGGSSSTDRVVVGFVVITLIVANTDRICAIYTIRIATTPKFSGS